MHDWATTGADPRFASGGSTAHFITLTASVDIDIFGAVNEYEAWFVYRQGATQRFIAFGSPLAKLPPPGHRGVCFSTQAITGTGSAQTVTVDRDITSRIISDGTESVWIYNQTAAGNAREANTIEIVTVSAASATTIDIDPSGNFATGAIIGLDPCPVYINSSITGLTAFQFTTRRDGTLNSQTAVFEPDTQTTEASVDPDPSGFESGVRGIFRNSSPAEGTPGWPVPVAFWTENSSTPQDRPADENIDNFNPDQKWAPIDGFTPPLGYNLNFGPYTTVGT